MKRLAILATIIAALCVSVSASAATMNATSFVFDPGNTGTAAAGWVKHLGNADPNDPGDTDRYGLLLSKNATSITTNSAAGATIHNVRGMHLTELGYDIRNGSHCGAGAPRYNVVTTDGTFHFVGGCSNGTITPSAVQGWSHVRFNPTSSQQAFPPVTPTEIVKSIDLIFDEGTDVGNNSGTAVVDDLDVNGFLIGAPPEAS